MQRSMRMPKTSKAKRSAESIMAERPLKAGPPVTPRLLLALACSMTNMLSAMICTRRLESMGSGL